MPEMKYFEVTQTRRVKVTANSANEAVAIASAAFEHGQDSNGGVAKDKGPAGVWGNTRSRIEVTSIVCEKDMF